MPFLGAAEKEPRECRKCGMPLSDIEATTCLVCDNEPRYDEEDNIAIMKAWFPDRYKEYLADKHRCTYCGEKIVFKSKETQDHIQPLSKGGSNKPENKVLCCHGCNQTKRDMTLNQFYIYLQVLF